MFRNNFNIIILKWKNKVILLNKSNHKYRNNDVTINTICRTVYQI